MPTIKKPQSRFCSREPYGSREIPFQHQSSCYPLIGSASDKALLYRRDDLLVLLGGQCYRALIQRSIRPLCKSQIRTYKVEITNFRPGSSQYLENTGFLCSYFCPYTNFRYNQHIPRSLTFFRTQLARREALSPSFKIQNIITSIG